MKRLTNEQFIEKAKEIHGCFYDYSKVEYIGANTNVCIICPIHGDFWQTPHNHLKGQKCPKCANITRGNAFRNDKEWFVKKAREIHGNKYDYSKVEYVNNHTKVCIICPTHGEFWQVPYSHLKGFGCKKCSTVFDTDTFIAQATKIYGDIYDYSNVKYEHSKKEVCIICPKHGEFYITPNNFLRGHSCPICKQSKLESEVREFLEENKIKFVSQKRYNWLGSRRLDFYLPNENIAIECQGGQHFKVVNWFGGKEGYYQQKQNDKAKKKLCEEHNIKLLYFTHEDYETFLGEELIKTTDDLLKRIKEKEDE